MRRHILEHKYIEQVNKSYFCNMPLNSVKKLCNLAEDVGEHELEISQLNQLD